MIIPVDKTKKVKEHIVYRHCNSSVKKCIFLKENDECSLKFETKHILAANEYMTISENCDLVLIKYDNFYFTTKKIKFKFK